MAEEFPLYPELSEEGAQEAQKLVDRFKAELTKAADNAIGDLYCDVATHIESDSWTNYRNKLMDGLQNYDNRLVQGEHDFKKIRQSILEEHREDLIKDLNQDLVQENEALKEQADYWHKRYCER
jgi:predicted HAD superfamily phosphohydrolase